MEIYSIKSNVLEFLHDTFDILTMYVGIFDQLKSYNN
jgi:hypothetical protein